MARLRGRAPRGERLVGKIPHGHWKTTTFLAGLRLSGMIAPLVFDGPINAAAFLAYVEQILVPELSLGDVVVVHFPSESLDAQIDEERLPPDGLLLRGDEVEVYTEKISEAQTSRRAALGLREERGLRCGNPSDHGVAVLRLGRAAPAKCSSSGRD